MDSLGGPQRPTKIINQAKKKVNGTETTGRPPCIILVIARFGLILLSCIERGIYIWFIFCMLLWLHSSNSSLYLAARSLQGPLHGTISQLSAPNAPSGWHHAALHQGLAPYGTCLWLLLQQFLPLLLLAGQLCRAGPFWTPLWLPRTLRRTTEQHKLHAHRSARFVLWRVRTKLDIGPRP